MRFLAAIAAVGICGLVAVLALQSGPDPDAVPTVDEVSNRMMSPFCEGLTLEECPHSKSAELREQIASRIRAGATNREIDAWMVANFGNTVRGRPSQWIAWLAPPAAALVGLAVLVYSGRRRRSGQARISPGDGPDLSPADRALVRQDLDRFRGELE